MECEERAALDTLRRGDLSGLEPLVRRYHARARQIATAITGDPAAAEDIAIAVFVQLPERLGTYDPSRPFAPWLFRNVSNAALDVLRQRRRELSGEPAAQFLLAQPARGSDPEEDSVRREEAERLHGAIRSLPPLYWDVVVRHYYLDMKEAAIAQALGCPLGTVKWRLHTARRRLRQALERRGSVAVSSAVPADVARLLRAARQSQPGTPREDALVWRQVRERLPIERRAGPGPPAVPVTAIPPDLMRWTADLAAPIPPEARSQVRVLLGEPRPAVSMPPTQIERQLGCPLFRLPIGDSVTLISSEYLPPAAWMPTGAAAPQAVWSFPGARLRYALADASVTLLQHRWRVAGPPRLPADQAVETVKGIDYAVTTDAAGRVLGLWCTTAVIQVFVRFEPPQERTTAFALAAQLQFGREGSAP